MGKAHIEEALGEGLYRVRIDSGEEYRDQMVVAIAEAITKLQPVRAELQAEVNAADAKRKSIIAEIDHLIGIYRQAVSNQVPSDQMDAIRDGLTDLATALADATRARQINALSLLDIDTLIAESQQQIDDLEMLGLVELQEAWCCDYTEDAAPELLAATMEVPGEPQQIILAPGVQPWSSAHGELVKKDLMAGHQAFFNVAILPGWQRFRPTYRIGTITEIHADDTVNVDLEGTSTAQNLDIGPPSTVGDAPSNSLWNVPADYMESGNVVFELNDRVVVLLENSDWAQAKVIGFEKEPRPVVGLLCHPDGQPRYRVFPRSSGGAVSWRSTLTPNPGSINGNYGQRGWTDGKKAVSWTNNRGSMFHRVFYRGRSANIVEMFPDLYNFNAANDYVMPWIMGAVAHAGHVVVLTYTYQPAREGTPEERLAAALPRRRIDLVSFKYNSESGPFWLDPTVRHSVVLPAMGYLSSGADAAVDPNHSGHLYGRCQGFSISPDGKKLLFFYDSEVFQFDAWSGSDGTLTTGMTTRSHPRPGEYKRIWRDVKTTAWSGTDPQCSLNKLISSVVEEDTQSDECSGEWSVGAFWRSDGSIGWVTYSAEVSRQMLVGKYATHEALTGLSWWKPIGNCSWEADFPNLYPSVDSYLMHELDVTVMDRSASYKYEGAVSLDIFMDTESSSSDRSTTYMRELRENAAGHWVYELVDTVIEQDSSHTPIILTGNFLHDHLDLNLKCLAFNAFSYQGVPPSVEEIGDIQISVDGNVIHVSDQQGDTHRNQFTQPVTMVQVQHDTYEGGHDNVWEGAVDPFAYNTASSYWFSPASRMADIKGSVFLSVELDGGPANWMTDNPSLTGVFPEDSGIDLTANFAPIVPF